MGEGKKDRLNKICDNIETLKEQLNIKQKGVWILTLDVQLRIPIAEIQF